MEYYSENKEKILNKNKEYLINNKEKMDEYYKKYWSENENSQRRRNRSWLR